MHRILAGAVVLVSLLLNTFSHAAPATTGKGAEIQKLKATILKQNVELSALRAEADRMRLVLGEATQATSRPSKEISTPAEKMKQLAPITSFENIPLADCLQFFKDNANVDMTIEWEALQAAGVDRQTPVTVHLRNCTFNRGLQLVLNSIESTGPAYLTYAIDANSLIVSTSEEFARHPITKTYDVADLLKSIERWQKTTPPQAREQLGKVLDSRVVPETWKDMGGPTGTWQYVSNHLTIVQTPAAMFGVDFLFDELRGADPIQELKASKATLARQATEISTMRVLVASLKTKCRSAGKEVPVVKNPAAPVPPEKVMDKVIAQVKFDHQPLGECLKYMQTTTGLNISVKWRLLKAVGVDPQTPVTLDAHNNTATLVFLQLLAKAGAGNGPAARRSHLTFEVDDDGVIVSTIFDIERRAMTRAYDVTEILGSDFIADQNALANLMVQIAPETWADTGGTPGKIRFVGSRMLIVQSSRVHSLIQARLEGLRQGSRR